jgi:predicted Zn-dependent peptidase
MANMIVKESKLLDEKYYTFNHKTGLKVYVFPKKLTTGYALFTTKYGAIDNKFKLEGENEFTCVPDGIAHFLEHKMFECENGEDAFELFAKTGASANAYTSNDRTSYLFSTTDNFYESLEYLLDFVTHPYFTAKTVEKEQGIIGQELRMYDDHAGARLEKGLLQALYEKNKVRIDVGGTIESIAEITADILYKCYNTFYNLNNMALVVCADVEPDKIEQICDKILKDAPKQKIIRDYECDDEPKSVYKKRSVCSLSVAKPIFAIGIKNSDIAIDPDENSKQFYAMQILSEMLYSRSGELYNELYSKKLISQDLDSAVEHSANYSFTVVSSESNDPEAVYDHFVSFVERTKQKGLDKEAFELAKRTIYAVNIKLFDSTDDIAEALMTTYLEGGELFEIPDIIASIDYDYIVELFNSQYNEDYFAMSIVNPITKDKEE